MLIIDVDHHRCIRSRIQSWCQFLLNDVGDKRLSILQKKVIKISDLSRVLSVPPNKTNRSLTCPF